ncbi:hypothetical protein [Pseudomonas sp. NPDC090208]|uniref:hypothetical protein n=1 Tax=Pseudomonas sp. NPDC090208 TaxID=3364478 RepID=UPI0038197DC1
MSTEKAVIDAKIIEVANVLQDLERFLDDTRQKRKPARDHDLLGDYASANITSVAKASEWLLPKVRAARASVQDLFELNHGQ